MVELPEPLGDTGRLLRAGIYVSEEVDNGDVDARFLSISKRPNAIAPRPAFPMLTEK